MKDFIQKKLVEMHRNCTTDKYGQVAMFNFGLISLFGERAEEVKAYAKDNPQVIEVSTYGSRYGTYEAVRIVDREIAAQCREALGNNANYKRNMNSW